MKRTAMKYPMFAFEIMSTLRLPKVYSSVLKPGKEI